MVGETGSGEGPSCSGRDRPRVEALGRARSNLPRLGRKKLLAAPETQRKESKSGEEAPGGNRGRGAHGMSERATVVGAEIAADHGGG